MNSRSEDMICDPRYAVEQIPNINIRRYCLAGEISAKDEQNLRLRTKEYAKILSSLQKANHQLHKTLLDCSKDSPCQLVFCLFCREKQSRKIQALVNSLDKDARENMFFETLIIDCISGAPSEIVKQTATSIAKFKRQFRNLINDRRQAEPWWYGVRRIGVFEIERYSIENYRKCRRARRHERKRQYPDKATLWKDLGVSSRATEDFYVLHLHSIVHIPELDLYRQGLARSLPFRNQIRLQELRDDKSFKENIRNLSNYMSKTMPRMGRTKSKDEPRAILSTGKIIDFVEIHA